MFKQMIEKLKNTIKNFDKKIVNILRNGLKFCFVVAIISVAILCTYLFFIHDNFIFQIGLTVFQLSLCFVAEFFASAIAIDTIQKQLE